MECLGTILPVISKVVNLALSTGTMPNNLKSWAHNTLDFCYIPNRNHTPPTSSNDFDAALRICIKT